MAPHGHAHAHGFGGAPSASWSPTDVSGCLLWLRARTARLYQDSAGTTPVTATSDPVGLWDDDSASNHDPIQATAGQRPTYDDAGLGTGKPAVSFDGTDDGLAKVATLTASAITVGLAYKLRAASGGGQFQTLLHVALDGSRAFVAHICNNGGYTTLTTACNTAGSNGVGVAGVVNDTTARRLILTYNGSGPTTPANWQVLVNGVAQTVAASGVTNVIAGITSLGKYPSGAFFAQLNLGAAVVYNSVLSAGDLTELDAYLGGFL